ncbi:MAG TPA: response regulator transcription factor [Bryobacteraceae bacterium]
MRSTKPIRVLICTKYTLFREGLKALLNGRNGLDLDSHIEVIGEAATAKQMIALLERLKPDVILLDPAASGLNAVEAVRRIRSADPRVKILVMPLGEDGGAIAAYLRAGAAGQIGRHHRPVQLQSAIVHSVYGRGVHAA